jgi:hypothetical protein
MLGGIDNALFFSAFGGFAALGFLIILLRWAFSRGKSLVEKPRKVGDVGEYGLLTSVAEPKNHIEGEILRQKLLASGVKATLVQTRQGPKVMVFADEVRVAEAILRS